MAYLVFLLALVALPLGGLVRWRIHQQRHWLAHDGAWLVVLAIATPAAIAWDHQAAAWGMWRWSTPLTLGWHWWGLPVEEVGFIILLVLVVVTLCAALRHLPAPSHPWRRVADVALVLMLGGGLWCAIWATHLALLPGRPHPMYLTYLLACALPLLASQWLVGGRDLWRARHVVLGVLLSVGAWYTLADALALRVRIWSFTPTDLTGARLGNVPLEETVFFGCIALLVAQTYLVLLARGWFQAKSATCASADLPRHAVMATPRRSLKPPAPLSGGMALTRRRDI